MSYITGIDRTQTALFPTTIDDSIEHDNPVRFVDTFVNNINVVEFGYKDVRQNINGRPPFNPTDLLKLYIYGYMNRIRSSRTLEKECKRNIELIWLMKGLVPDHNTIANFRKDNPKAIKKVFQQTVKLAKNLDLIGGVLLAIDGTRLRAQNSKKNNFNERKIAQHLEYIENKLEQYNQALANADGDTKKEIDKKTACRLSFSGGAASIQKAKYNKISKQLKESGEKQVSTSDPDSRQIMIRGIINEVAYNIQSTVDAKNKIPVDYLVINQNDKNIMSTMIDRTMNQLKKKENITFLLDKGYHNAEEIHKAHLLGAEVHVAIPEASSNAPDTAFNVSEFRYNKNNDSYTCPAGQLLRTNGNWYLKRVYKVKQYKTKHCKICELKARCSKAKYGRIIERHEFAEALEKNKTDINRNPQLYHQRQAIVEHPFGTMKRQWGFDYIMTKKTMKHASADVGLMFIAYNLKRIMNIIGLEKLLRMFCFCYIGLVIVNMRIFDLKTQLSSNSSSFLKNL